MNNTKTDLCCDVSVLVVGYNSQAFLGDALGAICGAAQLCRYELLFVNNGTDRSEEFVAKNFPQAQILPSRGNIGFGAANNQLAQKAVGNYLLLLNPDTRLECGAIDILLAAAKANVGCAIFGGLSINQHGATLAMSSLAFPSLASILRGVFGHGAVPLPSANASGVVPVDAVSGGFMMIRRDAWDALEGFDEKFFLYAEELDLCRRWHEKGGKVCLVPASRLMHAVGSGDPANPARLLLLMRGNATYFHKHFSPAHAQACALAQWLSCALRYAIGTMLRPFSQHYATLSRSMHEVALRPWRWWGGYR